MQRFQLLTELPTRLSCIILQDWLRFKVVMKLNSAYCCHSHREDFLDLLKSDEYFIREQVPVFFCCSAIRLLEKFGDKIRSVEFGSFKSTPVDLVRARCHHLTRVKFNCNESGTPALWDILKTNPQIERIKLSHSNPDCIPLLCSFDDLVLPKLSTLVVKDYQIQKDNILRVMQQGTIVRLDLSCCEIEGSLLLRIAKLCPNLQSLKLPYLDDLTDGILSEFTAICFHIVHLNIYYVDDITDEGILEVVQHLKGLQSLDITLIHRLTDASLVHIYTHCASTLHTIVLGRDRCIGPLYGAATLSTLLEKCTQLCELYLDDGYYDLTPLIFPPTALGNLTTISISGNVVSTQNLFNIATYAVKLQVLEVASRYVHYTIFELMNGCPKLRRLNYTLRPGYHVSIPENLVRASRESIRPGILITLRYGCSWRPTNPDCFNF